MSTPPRPVPNVTGETRVGDTITLVDTGTKRVAGFGVGAAQRFAKLSLCCDGNGGAAPNLRALVRAVVYQSDNLVGYGDEVIVNSGDPLKWVDLPFWTQNPGGLTAPPGTTELGIHVGGDASVLRVAQFDPLTPGGRWNADAYANGPATPFGTATSLTANMSIFATTSADWVPLDGTDPAILARTAWPTAQMLLDSGVLVSPTFDTAATWHGTSVDPNRGAFAVVKAGGPLADLVGERIKVTTVGVRPRSVLVYVFAAVTALDADLSLARRAFSELELLAADDVDVHVEVLG